MIGLFTGLTNAKYLRHKWSGMCSVFRHHYSVLSSFMINHQIFNHSSNPTGVSSDAGIAEVPRTHEFTSVFNVVHVVRSLVALYYISFGDCIVDPLKYGFWLPICVYSNVFYEYLSSIVYIMTTKPFQCNKARATVIVNSRVKRYSKPISATSHVTSCYAWHVLKPYQLKRLSGCALTTMLNLWYAV